MPISTGGTETGKNTERLFIGERTFRGSRIFGAFRAKNRRPLFEINTGAMAKGYRTAPYPSEETLEVIREMGGQLIISSDCHRAEMLDHGFAEAEALALKMGFRKADPGELSGVSAPLDIYI